MKFSCVQKAPAFTALLAPGLLAIAHGMTLIAFVSFDVRVGNAPLHPVGLIAYATATVETLAATGWLAHSYSSLRAAPGVFPLLALSPSAWASFIFWVGLGGPYAPYDAHDSDLVRLWHLSLAILFTLVAVVYGSLSYLAVTGTAQFAVYFVTYALPNYIHYPASGLLGPQPSIFMMMSGIYLTGTILIFLRARIVGRRTPRLWVASMLISFVSAFLLYAMLTWLPYNGAYVGYARTGSYVPVDGWDWTRSAAERLVIAALAAGFLTAPLVIIQRWRVD